MNGPSKAGSREPAGAEATVLQRAIIALEKMKARLDSVERAANEPIAIVGMGCRFPGGGEGPEAFWQLLLKGIDAVREIPPDRWPSNSIFGERQDARWAALLDDLSAFDASFFGISPREAESLDPQQRMLLEVTWESLEDAGIPADALVGSQTGVFIGICSNDYHHLVADAREDNYDAYCATGSTLSTAAGRISFVFGFQGPAISVDTACSSSLVAISQACQSLRAGDSDLALAGGVNALLSPRMMAMLMETQALSPDGRCKTLDARANGFVRGEGCGLLVLKRMSDAVRDGDRIRGMIRGWAVNQDGRSTGLTAPNVLSQQAMLRQALARARLSPADIGYVELHGTGTSLGDPIEAEALQTVLGAPRADGAPCVLGAVKTNIGHLEGAAGAAGVIKVLLAFEHERIPPNLHFRRLNPRISFEGTPFLVPTDIIPWPRSAKARRAGVSSFGISGTNAHIILEEAPAEAPIQELPEASAYLLPLSAKTPQALHDMVRTYADWFSSTNASLPEIIHTLTTRRVHHDYRLGFVARTLEEFKTLLSAAAQGETPSGVLRRANKLENASKVIFVFPGQGSQWIGMGRQLLAEEPAFRTAVEACDGGIFKEAGFSILEQLGADEAHCRIHQIDVVQPLLFAIQVALASLWRSWGVEPDCVVGHSMGEVAAAHVAGMLSLEDAVKVICRRSRLLNRISGRGGMALVELPIADAERAISNHSSRLGVAVSNGPRSTVLSGDTDALEKVLATLESAGIFCRRIKVDVASHSPQVEPLRADLLTELRDLHPLPGRIRMQSTVTGKELQGPELDATYWWDNLRQPVHFSQVTQDLLKDAHPVFVEISPHPVLLPAIEENLRQVDLPGTVIPSMRKQSDELRTMLEALGWLYVHSAPIQWDKRYPQRGRLVSLPAYPWQRERFWISASEQRRPRRPPVGHPLLGPSFVTSTQSNTWFWKLDICLEDISYLADHRVGGKILFPGAAYIEVALATAHEKLGAGSLVIDDLSFFAPLVLEKESLVQAEISLTRTAGDAFIFRFSTLAPGKDSIWTLHAEGRVKRYHFDEESLKPNSLAQVREICLQEVPVDEVFRRESRMGFEMGPAFRGLRRLLRGASEALGRIELSNAVFLPQCPYHVHPALLDAALRIVDFANPSHQGSAPRLLVKAHRIIFHHRPGQFAWSHIHGPASGEDSGPSMTLFDDGGRVCLSVEGLETRVAGEFRGKFEFRGDVFIAQRWVAAQWPAILRERVRGRFLLLCDDGNIAERIRDRLLGRGHDVMCVWARSRTSVRRSERLEADPSNLESIQALIGHALGSNTALTGIIHCWGLSANRHGEVVLDEIETLLRDSCGSALYVAQTIARMALRDMPRLWLVCRGAQMVPEESRPINLTQGPLWGLGRMISLEYPELKCTRIDLDPAADPNVEELVREFIARDNKEEEIAYRGSSRFAGHLERLGPPTASNSWPQLNSHASYLVTGGLGGAGLLAARWLVQAGAQHVVLTDKRDEATQADALRELESTGAQIVIRRADVTDPAQIAAVMQEIAAGPHPLKGIMHCAGALETGSLRHQRIDRLRQSISPRMVGGWNLHIASLHQQLDFLFFISSIHALMGAPALGGDVLGNVFLDALAHYRHERNLPATSINLGPLGVGVSTRLVGTERMAQHGMTDLSSDEGAALFLLSLREQWVQMGIAALDVGGWLESHPQAAGSPRFRGLAATVRDAAQPRTDSRQDEFRQQLSASPATARSKLLEDFVRQQLAAILRMEPSRIDRLAPVRGLGIDSLMSLELRNRIEGALGIRLSATLVWSHPTIAAMSKHIAELLAASTVASGASAPVLESRDAPAATAETTLVEPSKTDTELFEHFDASLERMRSRRKS